MALRSLIATPLRGLRFVGRIDQWLFCAELNEYCTAARCEELSDASNALAADTALAVIDCRGAAWATASLSPVEASPAPAGRAGRNSAITPVAMIPTRSAGSANLFTMPPPPSCRRRDPEASGRTAAATSTLGHPASPRGGTHSPTILGRESTCPRAS